MGRCWEALGAPKVALGGSGGVSKKRVQLPEGPRERPKAKKHHQNLANIVVLEFFKKNMFFFKFGLVEFPGGSWEAPERCVLLPSGLPGGPRES